MPWPPGGKRREDASLRVVAVVVQVLEGLLRVGGLLTVDECQHHRGAGWCHGAVGEKDVAGGSARWPVSFAVTAGRRTGCTVRPIRVLPEGAR